jgi:regulator of replication initiation timing
MNEHSNSMLRVQAAQLSAQLRGVIAQRNALITENAKLREQLAEAVTAIENIAGVTMSMVVNTQHLADERGRIAREYLRKHTPAT